MLLSGVGIEFSLTFILTFVIYATLLDPRAPQLGIFSAGLTLAAVTLLGLPLTGAALNPARWLGPVLWEVMVRRDALSDHVVYWVGPIFGALAAGALYEYVLWPAGQEKEPAPESAGGTAPVSATLFKKKT
jgi:aquaporin Z